MRANYVFDTGRIIKESSYLTNHVFIRGSEIFCSVYFVSTVPCLPCPSQSVNIQLQVELFNTQIAKVTCAFLLSHGWRKAST